MRFVKSIAAIALAASLAACATAGSGKIDWNKARQVKDGMTTKEVVKIMGEPYSVTAKDGRQIYMWVHVNAFTGFSQSASLPFEDGKVVKTFEIPDTYK